MRLDTFIKHTFVLVFLFNFLVPTSAEGSIKCGKRWERKAARLFEAGEYDELFQIMLPCAEKGHAEAQLLVALMLRDDVSGQAPGLTDEEREQKALEWLKRAAKNGDEDAMLEIANAYERGLYGLAENARLGACWRSVIDGRESIDACLALEKEELEQKTETTEDDSSG